MPKDYMKCPKCGTKSSVKKIIANQYACPNSKCELNWRLLVHGEVGTNGEVNKLYGWVLEPGTILKKKYEIIKMIGKGGFGATYLAHDLSMFNKLRAIKEIPRSFCDEKEDEFLTFLNHPAIPKLFERFNLRKFHYSVMEFIEGESLTDAMKKRSGGLPEVKVLAYAEQICDVLNYIHTKKVVHRDLKPDNIIIRKNGILTLIDFGISKQYIAGRGTRHLARAASHNYSSPEQYQAGKGNTDFKSDIYSFGAILYFLATGVEPIDALSRSAGKDISPLPRSLNPKISPRLERVIIKAMKMQKGERFNSIQEMKHALSVNGQITGRKMCPKCQALIESGTNFCPNCGSPTKPLQPIATLPVIITATSRPNGSKPITKSSLVGIPKGKVIKKELNLNNGSRFKYKITSLTDWIKVEPKRLANRRQKLKLTISTKNLTTGVHTGRILIEYHNRVKYIHVTLKVVNPLPEKRRNSFVKLIFLSILIGLTIRYFSTSSSVAFSMTWIIAAMGSFVGTLSSHYGKTRFISGFLVGASLAALMIALP